MGKAWILPRVLCLIILGTFASPGLASPIPAPGPTKPDSRCGICEYSDEAMRKCYDLEERFDKEGECQDEYGNEDECSLSKHIAECEAYNGKKKPYDRTATNLKTTEEGTVRSYGQISGSTTPDSFNGEYSDNEDHDDNDEGGYSRICEPSDCIECDGGDGKLFCIDDIRRKVETALQESRFRNSFVTKAVSLRSWDHSKDSIVECVGLTQLQITKSRRRTSWNLSFYPLPDEVCNISIQMWSSKEDEEYHCQLLEPSHLLPKNEPCLRSQSCKKTKCVDLRNYCLDNLYFHIKTLTGLFGNNVPFVFSKYLEIPGICDKFGYASQQALRGVLIAHASAKTTISRMPFEVLFYEQKPSRTLWSFNVSHYGTIHGHCPSVSKYADVPVFPMSCPVTPTTRAVTTTTSVTSLSYTPTTATTDSDGGYDALKNGEAQDHCPGYSVAIAAFLSFIAGILTVLAVLFVRRYLRKNKSCFGKNDDASTRTVAGASQSVTAQLDHGLGTGQAHATALNAYEPMEGANMHAAAENPYQTLDYIKPVQYSAENEHVYTGIGGQTGSDKDNDKPQKTNGSQTGQTSGTENTYFVLEKEDSGDAGAQIALQASGTENTYFVLEKEAQIPSQASGTENTYFVLEKEAQIPSQASGTENTYFVLEKEAQMPPQTGGTENTYFVLERESSSDAPMPPKANGADNTKFVPEKEARLSSKTGGTDNMRTGH